MQATKTREQLNVQVAEKAEMIKDMFDYSRYKVKKPKMEVKEKKIADQPLVVEKEISNPENTLKLINAEKLIKAQEEIINQQMIDN